MPRVTNIQARKGTATEWSTQNPVLDSGELGYDTTNKIFKIGDGTTAWNSLSNHNHSSANISDSTTAGRALLTGADAAAQRTSLGLGSLATQSGTFSGTSSGTNTGNQTISIGGDVTAAGSTGVLTATVTKVNGVALSGLSTGLLKNTTTTGAPSIAIAGTDYAAASHTHTASQISDSTTAGRALLTGADAAAQRTSLGLGTMATQASSSYSLTSHSHTSSDITNFNTAVNGLVSGVYAPLSGATFSGTIIASSIAGNAASNNVVDGRLTIYTGDPIGSEVGNTFGSTLYFTPFNGNRISLYDTTNSRWQIHTFSEISISLASGYATNTMYDVFIFDNAGTKTLELTAWTTQGGYASPAATVSARSTGSVLALQDGVYVKSGSPNKRYLGTARTIGTAGFISDGPTQRFLWNMYNRVNKNMSVVDTTTHTYATAAFRLYRNQSSNIVEFITGLDRYTAINMTILVSSQVNPVASIPVGIGLDVTNNVNTLAILNNVDTATLRAAGTDYSAYTVAGYHYLAMVQYGATGAGFNNANLTASITC